MSIPRTTSTLLLSLALVAGSASTLHAQSAAGVQQIPEKIIASPDVRNEEAMIRQFVEPRAAVFKAGEPQALRNARKDLLAPLGAAKVSPAFRSLYARVVCELIGELVKDPRDLVAFNAVRLCGELGASSAVPLLLEALSDPREPLCYAAAQALGRTLAINAPLKTPAITQDEAGRIVDALTGSAGVAPSAAVLDKTLMALDATVHYEESALRLRVLTGLSRATLASAKALAPERSDLAARAGAVLRGSAMISAAINDLRAEGSTTIPPEVTRDAGEAAKGVLRAVAVLVRAGKGEELPVASMVQSANGLLIAATAQETKLESLAKDGGERLLVEIDRVAGK